MSDSVATIPPDRFPHIWADIAANAQWDTLIALRATCRPLRAAADARLFAHAALLASPLKPPKRRFGTDDPHAPATHARITLWEPHAPNRRLPFLPRLAPITDRHFVWDDTLPWPPVSVLDTYRVPPAPPCRDLGLRLLRDFSDTPAHPVLAAECVTRDLHVRPRCEVVCAPTVVVHPRWPSSDEDLRPYAGPGAGGAEGAFGMFPAWNGTDAGPDVRELVFVFPTARDHHPHVEVEDEGRRWCFARLEAAVTRALVMTGVPLITVVGVEAVASVPPYGAGEGLRWTDVIFWGDDKYVRRVRFMTEEEVRAEGRIHPAALEGHGMRFGKRVRFEPEGWMASVANTTSGCTVQ